MMWRRGKAHSQDLRSRVLAAADEGIPVGRIATTFRVSVSYVSKVLGRRRASGETAAPKKYAVTLRTPRTRLECRPQILLRRHDVPV